MNIVISSGHGKLVRGAKGILDEVDEARRVVEEVAKRLRNAGVTATTFHDDKSETQNENLNRIVDFHNGEIRALDVSVHFNAYENTDKPMGTECLYVTQSIAAEKVSTKISQWSGLKNRGAKKRTDLFFLNNTDMPALLIEVCFVDSSADAKIYNSMFNSVCAGIVEALSGVGSPVPIPPDPIPEPAPEPPGEGPSFSVKGKASYFGGPDDTGVAPEEGLAFITAVSQAPHLFLPYQPPGTTGLARRLNPHVHYIACRWDYDKTPKATLLEREVTVFAPKTGLTLRAFPADWGPNEDTGRVADLSPRLIDDLGIKTDDQVEVTLV